MVMKLYGIGTMNVQRAILPLFEAKVDTEKELELVKGEHKGRTSPATHFHPKAAFWTSPLLRGWRDHNHRCAHSCFHRRCAIAPSSLSPIEAIEGLSSKSEQQPSCTLGEDCNWRRLRSLSASSHSDKEIKFELRVVHTSIMGKSTRLTIVLAGARVFMLGMLALLLTLPCDSSAGAVNFTYNGFDENFHFIVPQGNWVFDTKTRCFSVDPPNISGRFLYPDTVLVRDPESGTVKSFSTTFIIYRLQKVSTVSYRGPGMAFMMVADDTSGPTKDFMGFHGTKETLRSVKNYDYANHDTLGVELDIFKHPEFNDRTIRYQQIWIDYSEAKNRVDVYYANYQQGKSPKPQDKPAKPQVSKIGLDLSLLKENMYIGFSTAKGIKSSSVLHFCAWSFSNTDSQAPPIVIAEDFSPAASTSLPSSHPSAPPPFTNAGPSQIPAVPSPAPISPSPIGSPPSPFKPLNAPSQGPGGHEPPSVGAAVGGSLAVLVVLICLFSLCWYTIWRRPLRIFISHAGGPNGAGKNFPSWLHQAMSRQRWSSSKFHVKPFLDVENCPKGLSFAGKILKELERFDVGVVVVTPDFFSRHWPMTELIKFVEVQQKHREGRIRVLPLFYELKPDELQQGLDQRTWESFWVESSEDNHPLQLQECRDAVKWLCKQTGIRYVSHNRDQDRVYIDTILKEVDKILCDERSITADLRWAMKKLNFTRSGGSNSD